MLLNKRREDRVKSYTIKFSTGKDARYIYADKEKMERKEESVEYDALVTLTCIEID